MGRFILDFYAPNLRLAVEVDGGYHDNRVSADARRDRELARWGVVVLRIPGELVIRDFEAALGRVIEATGG